jgi:hypothetical protein
MLVARILEQIIELIARLNVVTERYSNSQHELFQQGTTCIPERPQNIRKRILRARSYQIHVNI